MASRVIATGLMQYGSACAIGQSISAIELKKVVCMYSNSDKQARIGDLTSSVRRRFMRFGNWKLNECGRSLPSSKIRNKLKKNG
jgi:hypothetical protein